MRLRNKVAEQLLSITRLGDWQAGCRVLLNGARCSHFSCV